MLFAALGANGGEEEDLEKGGGGGEKAASSSPFSISLLFRLYARDASLRRGGGNLERALCLTLPLLLPLITSASAHFNSGFRAQTETGKNGETERGYI